MATNILITGCARSGTSLLTYLMCGFAGLRVETEREWSPETYRPSSDRSPVVIKKPQGHRNPHRDFKHSQLTDHVDSWRVLICIRDGRDVICSRHVEKPDDYYVEPDRWIHAVERALSIAEHPNVQLVKYEALVQDPAACMLEIGQSLGVDYENGYLDHFHEQIAQSSPMAQGLGSARPVDSNSVGRWQLPEHHERIATVYRHWGSRLDQTLAAVGYEPLRADGDSGLMTALAEYARRRLL